MKSKVTVQLPDGSPAQSTIVSHVPVLGSDGSEIKAIMLQALKDKLMQAGQSSRRADDILNRTKITIERVEEE